MSVPSGYRIVKSNFENTLEWPEYLVFGAVLVASFGIGIFFGFFGNKNKTNEEFIMAGRSMSILPVTLSLICSFVSAVTLLGNPVEGYFYGQQVTTIAFIPMTLVLAYLYVPVFFSLGLSSAYQYFEWRFSRPFRTMCSIFAILHLMLYMPITVLGPSLALDQVAGLDYRISAVAIFFVCISYSTMGGLKAVLWTDALQAGVIMIAMFALAICGAIEVGGINLAWERGRVAGRLEFFDIDPDPRTRHTFWTSIIGGFVLWLTMFGATQSQIQRYNSVATLRESRQCLLLAMLGMMTVYILCGIMALLIYAQYYNCDPVQAGLVSSADQLLPLFVIDALRNYPSLPGLLIAGLTSGSLSTVSSALNSLSALITVDFVKRYWPEIDEVKLGYVSKFICVFTGIIAFGLVFLVEIVNKTIQIGPFYTLMTGSLIGPVLGAFTLGLWLPWVNNLGITIGMVISVLLSGFVGLGNILAGRKNLLPNMRLDLTLRGCPCANSTNFEGKCEDFFDSDDSNQLDLPSTSNWKDTEYSFLIRVWSTSYMWQPTIGAVSTIILGILFSFIVNKLYRNRYKKVHATLLSKPFIKLWNKVFGEVEMEKWIDYDESIVYGKHKNMKS